VRGGSNGAGGLTAFGAPVAKTEALLLLVLASLPLRTVRWIRLSGGGCFVAQLYGAGVDPIKVFSCHWGLQDARMRSARDGGGSALEDGDGDIMVCLALANPQYYLGRFWMRRMCNV